MRENITTGEKRKEKFHNGWKVQENITTDAKRDKILQLVGSAGKDYNLWKAWENIRTGGKRGKSYNRWVARENFITGGKCRKLMESVGKYYN